MLPLLRRLRFGFFLGLGLLLASSCGAKTTISESDFLKTCTQDSDCIVVFVGNLCSCTCKPFGISASEQSKYENEFLQLECGRNPTQASSGGGGSILIPICRPCPRYKAFCDPQDKVCAPSFL